MVLNECFFLVYWKVVNPQVLFLKVVSEYDRLYSEDKILQNDETTSLFYCAYPVILPSKVGCNGKKNNIFSDSV